jgi:fructokinase
MIVVGGEALIDTVLNGDGTKRATPGGGPFNTARALGRLGVPTAFLGRFSDDVFGRELTSLLVSEGVSLELASIGNEPSTIAIAELGHDGLAEYDFLVEGTSAPNLTPEMVPEAFGPEVDALHIGTLGLVLEPMASTLAELASREHGKRLVMVDPNIRVGLIPDSEYRDRLKAALSASSIVKASEADLDWVFPGLDYQHAADQILRDGVGLVIVTLGARGAFGAHDRARLRVDAPVVEVVDTIGAGDAFGAALLAWLHDHNLLGPSLSLRDEELRSALEFACLAGALTCTRAGAEPPWKSEMISRA